MYPIVGPTNLALALAVTKAGTSYSDSMNFSHASGFSAALITTTAGSITVTMQASEDDSTWYDVYDTDGTTVLGTVIAAMTVGTKYLQFDPVVAKYVRFKIVEGNIAATAVTINFQPRQIT